ncbi:MAG TPA: hypothetical protein VMG10_10385 [Gemmataceae bacterium]|nr:hypothetical protein [Gemmataceae bacterium]
MPSDPPVAPLPNGEARPDPGLPTVTPPSGGMFFRLFGVPALIVGGVVLVLILAQPLIGKFGSFLGRNWGSSSPEQFLHDLDDSNAEVRWRAANDLAQVLLRDDDLASNSDFALQLTRRLRHTLDSSAPFEKAHAEHFAKLSPQDEASELKKLDPDRNYILLLTQCLGHFMVPVGAPVLKELAVQESGLDPRALNARRRQALWALANLGENVKRFDKLSSEQQEAVKSQLTTAANSGDQGDTAKKTLIYLLRRQQSLPSALGVDRVIEKCADSEDPSLRELAAFIANFWSGTTAENARMEKTLIRLCDDPGKGDEDLAKLEEENADQETRKLVKKPGFRVQVNAAVALARQGWKVRLSLLQTMLDEDELRSIFVVQSKKGGAEQPDQAAVVETMLNALKAVAELHRKDPQRDLSSLRPNIDKLAHNPNPALQTEAGRVVLALSKP